MSTTKRTKDILRNRLSEIHHRQSNNDDETIESLRLKIQNLQRELASEKQKHEWTSIPNTISGSGIQRNLVYTPLDIESLDYFKDLGLPGNPPYTRGIHRDMYRGKKFTLRQLSGAGTQQEVNLFIKSLLTRGATGINLPLDLPTIQMYDSDESESKGQIGVVGVPIDHSEDMDIIFEGIPIDRLSVSLVTHYPINTAALFPMFLASASRKRVGWEALRGSVQNDFIMESVVRSALEYIPPKDSFRIQCDNIEFIRNNVPAWNCITFNGYNLRDFGTSGITDMAVALANAIATLEEMKSRGYSPDWIAERFTFFWSTSNDFFEEIARIRAVRRLWYRIMKYRFDSKNAKSMWMRCHVQTSGVCLTREEPYNNIVRAAYHALAAVLGGSQSLHVNAFDESYSIPSEESSLIALRTQQIIQEETAITEVVDPLGGSYYVESLTNEIERNILNELDEIEKLGGIVQAVETGWLQAKINEHIHSEQENIIKAKTKIVARNIYNDPEIPLPNIKIHSMDPEKETKIVQQLNKYRDSRDQDSLEKCLEQLRKACRTKNENIVPFCMNAVQAGATEGEIRRALLDAFPRWIPSHTI